MTSILVLFSFLFSVLPAAPEALGKFQTGGAVFGAPVPDGELVYVGGNNSVLYALDAATGKPRWTLKTRGPIRSTVAIEGDRIFLVGGDGVVSALEKATGSVSWTFTTGGEKLYSQYRYADYFFSSPVVGDGVVYFGSGDGNI